jgi:hypothetical protein
MAELRALQAQVDAQIETLRTAARFLESVELSRMVGGQLNPAFRAEFGRRQQALASLRRDLDGQQPAGDGWARLEEEALANRRLYQRLLGYIEAELFRSAGLDEGVATIADALLAELATVTDLPWRRQVLMGGEDVYDERSELVRIRFPQYSIWLVPVLAHEFGHFASSRIFDDARGTPVLAAIAAMAGQGLESFQAEDAAAIRAQRESFLHELFADTFATWVLGPAFACSCLLLALNPMVRASRQHPSARVRAHGILLGLGRLNQLAVGRPFTPVLARLSPLWPDAATMEGVDVVKATSAFLDILAAWLPPEARYDSWLEDATLSKAVDAMRKDGKPNAATREATLRTLLNASWSARLDAADERQLARIGQAARGVVFARAEALLPPAPEPGAAGSGG